MAERLSSVIVNIDETRKTKLLICRRSILLLILGCTPSNNEALKYVLNSDLLFTLKSWLLDILKKQVGGVDLLLHLLDNMCMLPVSKEMVTSSKLGRQVNQITNNDMCKNMDDNNKKSIKQRVDKVKSAWKASAKLLQVSRSTNICL
jgi:hypothetical protein